MGSAANTKTSELDELLKAVGDDVIRAYRDKYFPARIVQACPSVYSIENASKWIKFEKFCSFVAQFLQEQSPSPSPSNINLRGPDPDPSLNENQRALTQTKRGRRSSTSTCQTPTADRPTSDTGESDNETGVTVPLKRRRTSSVTKQSGKRAAGMIQVTRQSWVSKVETLTDVPEHWRVPESGDSVAYILDLTADTREWLDSKGKTMTMSAVIKQKCTDAWAGGTGGSLSKATTVTLLGEGVKCQKMSHDCRGVFLCSRAAVDLWKDYKRDSDESDETEFSLQSERNHLVEQESLISHYERPVAFYNSVVKDKCQFDNGRCAGRPEIKKDDIMFPINGHHSFIGCSAVTTSNTPSGHIFRQIPKDVDGEVLLQLFGTGRVNFSEKVVFNGPCIFTVPPRTGLKQKHCTHVHIQDGKITEATMQQRHCPAKLTIFTPVDHSVRKAVIIPASGAPHNHPFCPWDKRSRRAKAAARAACISEPTPDSIDRVSGSSSNANEGSNLLGLVDRSNSLLSSGSSLSAALMAPGYLLEKHYP